MLTCTEVANLPELVERDSELIRSMMLRRVFGPPSRYIPMEDSLRHLNLWPAEAQPLPVDTEQVILRLRDNLRAVVFGLMDGMSAAEMAAREYFTSPQQVYHYRMRIRDYFTMVCQCFGALPPAYWRQGDPIPAQHVARALNVNYGNVYRIAWWAGVSPVRVPPYSGGYPPEDFPKLWHAAQDRERAS